MSLASDHRRIARRVLAAASLALVAACAGDASTAPLARPSAASASVAAPTTLVSASGDLTAAVAQCRTALGAPLNGVTVGEQPTGRREINWDAVPAVRTNNNNFPANFFNVNSPRGAVFSSPGGGFRVSDTDFEDVRAGYGAQFNFFSATKTFSQMGTNQMDVEFRAAGTTTEARTTGFCVIFSDVDADGSASIELFDGANRSLGRWSAPVRSDAAGLSIVGAVFGAPIVKRVRIYSGQFRLGGRDVTDGGQYDLVVMDDFFYGEPHASR